MLTDLALGLAHHGIEVSVITSRQRYDDPSAHLSPLENVQGVTVYRVATPAFGRNRLIGRLIDYLGFYVAATWTLFRRVDSNSIIVAKTDPPLISIPATLVCKLRSARLINWLQDLFPEVAIALGIPGLQGWLGGLLQRWRNWSLQTADYNVVIGESMRLKLIEQGIVEPRIKVIHNWADGESIKPVPHEKNDLRKSWELSNKFIVGYSGNLGRAHEFETLLGAAEILRNENDIAFLFVGGGALSNQIKALAREKSLNNLLFKHYQPREMLSQSLGSADVHVAVLRPELEGLIVPSKYYGIAAAGRATLFIGDENGEIANILRNTDSGLTIPIGNPQQLANTIRSLKNSATCNRMGINARTGFENRYAYRIALEQWLKILKD